MRELIRLSPQLRSDDPLRMLNGAAVRFREVAQSWHRRRRALGDLCALRRMSDSELTDLGIGRGEVTRDVGSVEHG